jgi:dTDP-4-amino-4,6-dideoxygalactose transaminase
MIDGVPGRTRMRVGWELMNRVEETAVIGGGSSYTPGLIHGVIRHQAAPEVDEVSLDIERKLLEKYGQPDRRQLNKEGRYTIRNPEMRSETGIIEPEDETMTKIDVEGPLYLPDAMKGLVKLTEKDYEIEVGEGHLQRQYQEIADEARAAIEAVLPTGKYTLGPVLEAFEHEFAQYCDSDYAIGISSGTAALHLALEALGIGPGDEVITVSNTYIATSLAITYTGATPVFTDIEPDTYNMTAGLAAEKITPRTKALLPVHMYGHPVDMDPIMELAREHDLKVLEDASHAHGAEYKGRRTGSLGDMAAFSFYPGKNLGAYGDGGGITTSDGALDKKARILRYVGQRVKFVHEVVGFQERLDPIQAAVLRVKLKRLDEWNSRRRRWAGIYNEMLADTPLKLPYAADDVYHVYYSYATIVPSEQERLELMSHCLERGIGVFAMYPALVPMQGAYRDLDYSEGDFPVAASYARRVMNLPMFETLTEAEVVLAAETILAFYDRA